MQSNISRDVYHELAEVLTEHGFLKRAGLTKKRMVLLLREQNWQNRMKSMLQGLVTCKGVLDACESTMTCLCEKKPEQGWLAYTYGYLRNELFPGSTAFSHRKETTGALLFYLEVLSFFLRRELRLRDFDTKMDFAFVTEEELLSSACAGEYKRLLEIFSAVYFYPFLRMGGELEKFDVLGHIAGVHYIAMHVARQLKEAGVPIDLGLVSGAAIGHDIGKFGCGEEERGRIPYLHYYYTHEWFLDKGLPTIGHIATNHSTWDLELENLPVESLVLIYADFRVKSGGYAEGKEKIVFFSLKDSFQVILDKLDQVNLEKEKRYRHVYAKLLDFERYMESLGVNTDLSRAELLPPDRPDSVLLSPSEAVEALKYLAISHNISLMNRFTNELTFGAVLEAARSETSWKNTRAYLGIFEEYCAYMTQKQKMMTLHFLYELLMHREGDIRRQAADLLGCILVCFDEEHRKELPKGVTKRTQTVTGIELFSAYLSKMIEPDHKITERHKRFMEYTLKIVVNSALLHCNPVEKDLYLNRFLAYYKSTDWEDQTVFALLDSMLILPFSELTKKDQKKLLSFAQAAAKREPKQIHIALLRFLGDFTQTVSKEEDFTEQVTEIVRTLPSKEDACAQFLIYRILENWGIKGAFVASPKSRICEDPSVVADVFLENLKAATPWIVKTVNIELLQKRMEVDSQAALLHVATHFSNLIKVSEQVGVRHSAGKALLCLAPLLSLDQRNEVVIELTKGLEIGQYEFSKYIPEYLGELVLYLHPKELDEFIKDLHTLLISTNEKVVCVALDTLGIMVQNYGKYRERFFEEKEVCLKRQKKMLGMLLSGLANYRETVSQEAFLVIGRDLFGSKVLSLPEKERIFCILYKKLLILVGDREKTDLDFFNSAAFLNHIYRFISDYLFCHESFPFVEPNKIAFFPGTFDPFSLGHLGMAKEIRNMGFTVYLALDEFSWSKKTQARLIRKKIISLSIAGEENIYLFPDDIPVNIANPWDLKRLSQMFSGKEIYMVAGTDVLKNASSYQGQPAKYSIHTMNHILFLRKDHTGQQVSEIKKMAADKLSAKVIYLTLIKELEEISSTQIRDSIDANRDISGFMDAIAQNYIYHNNLYLREPQDKEILDTKSIYTEVVQTAESSLLLELSLVMTHDSGRASFLEEVTERGCSLALIRRNGREGRIVGAAAFRPLGTNELYGEFQSTNVANYIRSHVSGKMVMIAGVYVEKPWGSWEPQQVLATETLAYCMEHEFTYALYSPRAGSSEGVASILLRQGFYPLPENDTSRFIYGVDMKQPLIIFADMSTMLKAPFHENERVLEVIKAAHEKLQMAMTALFPGNLVLSFQADVINSKLLELITKSNGVAREVLPVRRLGKLMCVPFGKILKGVVVPNTVTKALHTEKIFEPKMKQFTVREYPNYSSLVNQIRTIRSFHRPVLLVDDLLHKGYRMQVLDPLLKQEKVPIDGIIVGVLSGRGRDLCAIQHRRVESAYFLPSIRNWFNESALYPFIGGDSVERQEKMPANLLDSVNFILPYVAPGFLRGARGKAIYELSMTCLLNAESIMKVLEEEYQRLFERNLTLSRLSEVIVSPGCPNRGGSVSYDYHLPPSWHIAGDMEALIRLEHMVD